MYEYKFEVDRVVDGDTVDGFIDLGFGITIHKRVRLLGIDTPETRTRDLAEKKAGIEAKDYLIGILTQNRNVVKIRTEKDDTGKYGRLLGTLIGKYRTYDTNADPIEVNINELMIEVGHALPYGA